MEKIRQFLVRKDVVFTLQRYGIDALGAMAQGLFCTLLVGTILNTLGQQFGIGFLTRVIVTVGMALTLPISSAAICAALGLTGDRKSTRLNSIHITRSRMPSSA